MVNFHNERQKRNILGNVISKITGLSTKEQLAQVAQMIMQDQDQMQATLMKLVDLTIGKGSITERLQGLSQHMEHLKVEISQLGEAQQKTAAIVLYVIQFLAIDSKLSAIVDHYVTLWENIISSILHGYTIPQIMPEQALTQAMKIFKGYYGKQKGLIKFGIQKENGIDYIKTL
jgi:hypothetical protein